MLDLSPRVLRHANHRRGEALVVMRNGDLAMPQIVAVEGVLAPFARPTCEHGQVFVQAFNGSL